MLEKPNIQDELIISRLQEEYNLHISSLTFLPIGADIGSIVYRVVAEGAIVYFLKLRKNFDEISVRVPLFLQSQGIQEIIPPFKTRSGQGWADFDDYKIILYPFVEGGNGFERILTDRHKRIFGEALKGIHSVRIPPNLQRLIPQETFSPFYRERMKSIQEQVEHQTFTEPTAAKLAALTKSKREEIKHLIERAETLTAELQSQPLEFVLCHTDIHGGNIIISHTGEFYIVDWDAPLLAPKERDLMFIGGGIDHIWKSKRDEVVFYEGYGETEINIAALAYYRYERIIEDLVAYADQLLLTNEGGADREEGYHRFAGNFEPGETIEIAENTYKLS